MLRARLLVVLVAVALVHVAAAAAAKLDLRATSTLAVLLDDAVQDADPPGLVAMVVDHDRVLFEHAAGKLRVAGGVPMRTDAIFRIHSMTKPVTTVVAMMLVDEGRLDPDARVSVYLPAFASPQVIVSLDADGTAVTRPAKTPLTIRHLLTHTSGIGYAFSNPTLLQLTAKTGNAEIDLPLLHDPGAAWTYGAGTRVLGDVIERITGESLAAVFDARLFRPLGMHDTSYRVPDEKRLRVMSRHQRKDGRLVEEPVADVEESPVRGDSGLYSTARDYAAFVQLLLNDGQWMNQRLISRRAMRLMRESQIGRLEVTRQPDADPTRTRPFPSGAGRDRFSFGFQIAAAPARGVHARSKGSMSWGGLRNTHFWIDPEARLAAVLMTQLLPFYDDTVMALLAEFEERLYAGME